MSMPDRLMSDFMDDYANHGKGALELWLKEHPEHAREIIDMGIMLDAYAVTEEPTAEDITHAEQALRRAFHEASHAV